MNSTQLAQIRYDFYTNLRRRVESILGVEPKSLRVYREAYERELEESKIQFVDKRHLFARVRQAQVVLIGDFHAQKQSTRGFLRIVRKVTSPISLALECLRADDQDIIDDFVAGKIAEKDFLHKISWKKTWGFPWENYRPLFKWAQINKIKVYGINSSASKLTLRQRDDFSAQIINDILRKDSSKKIFVQYGDLHLATAHLPSSIRKKIPKVNMCVIYQSPEELYFKVMIKQKESTADLVRLSHDSWALNGVPPWVKWQDYLLHLESGQDRRISSSEIDATDTVAQTVEFLGRSFGLQVDVSRLSVFSSDDDSFFTALSECSLNVRKRAIENVQEGISFFIPEIGCGYLARYSVNHVTRVAAQFLYWQEGKFSKSLLDNKKDFYKFIWLEAVIYFFAKVKNPKKKTDTLQDIRQALQKEQFDDRGKEALNLALTQKMNEVQFLAGGKARTINDEVFKRFSKKSFLAASQILGGIIGEKIYYAASKQLLKFPENKFVLFKDLNSTAFNKIYFESLEMVESWPISFKSKYDKL